MRDEERLKRIRAFVKEAIDIVFNADGESSLPRKESYPIIQMYLLLKIYDQLNGVHLETHRDKE